MMASTPANAPPAAKYAASNEPGDIDVSGSKDTRPLEDLVGNSHDFGVGNGLASGSCKLAHLRDARPQFLDRRVRIEGKAKAVLVPLDVVLSLHAVRRHYVREQRLGCDASVAKGGIPQDFEPRVLHAAKDLRYYSRMVQESKFSTPVSPAVLGAFTLAEALGEGEAFVPRLCDVIAGINQVDVHKR